MLASQSAQPWAVSSRNLQHDVAQNRHILAAILNVYILHYVAAAICTMIYFRMPSEKHNKYDIMFLSDHYITLWEHMVIIVDDRIS